MSLPRPVILLHGWTMRGAVFDRLTARLGPGFACLAPDLPGHGAARDTAPGLDACAEVLDRALAQTGPAAIVIGWSMGAAVAWSHVAQHGGEGFAGLVTIDMAPRLVNGPDWQLGLLGQTPERLRQTADEMRNDWPTAMQKIARTMFARREGGEDLSRGEAIDLLMSNAQAAIAPYWHAMLAMDLRPAIPLIKVPYLVTHGGQSRIYPADTADWLAQTAPQARRQCFAGSGHSPHLEEPAAFAEAIRVFAAGLSPT